MIDKMKTRANQINIIIKLWTSFVWAQIPHGLDNVQSVAVSMMVIKSLPQKKKTSGKKAAVDVQGILLLSLFLDIISICS
jgi:hypothetical protein